MTEMEILANHRMRLRQLAGLSLRDLADRCGVSKSRLSLWEHGQSVLHSNETRTVRNVILELSGKNHREVVRLLRIRTRTGRNSLLPRKVESVSYDRCAELCVKGEK